MVRPLVVCMTDRGKYKTTYVQLEIIYEKCSIEIYRILKYHEHHAIVNQLNSGKVFNIVKKEKRSSLFRVLFVGPYECIKILLIS